MLPKILIARLGAFGDVCMAIPLVRSLLRQADVHWLVRRDYEPLIRSFLGDSCRLWGVVPQRQADNPFEAALIDHLRSQNFAAFVDLSHWPVVRQLARRLTNIPLRAVTVDPEQDQRLGLPDDDEGTSPFNVRIAVDPHIHQADKWRSLFTAALSIDTDMNEWPLPALRPLGPRLRVYVHPHAGKPAKKWPIANFVKVLRSLAEERPLDCYVNTGSKREAEAAVRLWLRLLPSRCRVRFALVDHSFARLRRLLETVDVAIGCDSGPMHFASLLGVPTVPIFGPYSPLEFGPLFRTQPVEPIRAERPAAEVAVDQVVDALRASLANRRQPTGVAL